METNVKEEYERNGAVCLRDFLPKEWIEKVTLGIEKVYKRPSKDAQHLCYKGGHGAHFRDFGNWQHVPEIKEFIFRSHIGKSAAELLSSSTVTLYHDQIIVKDPHDVDISPFHVEMSNYPFTGNQGCSVWVPVDPVPLETTIKFVVGSHLWGKNFYPMGVVTDENRCDEFEHVPDIRAVKEAMITEWNLAPGDVLVYNMKTLISSNGNVTDHVQRALVTHLFGEDIKFTDRPWAICPPVTGKLKIGEHPSKDADTFPVVHPESAIP